MYAWDERTSKYSFVSEVKRGPGSGDVIRERYLLYARLMLMFDACERLSRSAVERVASFSWLSPLSVLSVFLAVFACASMLNPTGDAGMPVLKSNCSLRRTSVPPSQGITSEVSRAQLAPYQAVGSA